MKSLVLSLLTLTILATINDLHAQGTAFTYQGSLNSGGAPAGGQYDFRFKLASDALGNNSVTSFVLTNAVPVSNGLFVVTIDFGTSVFNGSNLWLGVEVRTNNPPNLLNYTMLIPLQAITPTPSAVFASTAGNVVGNVSSASLSGTYGGALTLSNSANSITGTFTGSGANVTNVNAATLNGLNQANFWQLGGNNVASGQTLGSTNNQPMQILVNNQVAMQFVYASNSFNGYSPNLVGGISANFVNPGLVGAVIAGGGATNFDNSSNIVSGNFGVVLGGIGNNAGALGIAGGFNSTATGFASVALGQSTALGQNSTAMGSGYASGVDATAFGQSEAEGNNSFAAGIGADAKHDGCFVWTDEATNVSVFPTTSSNQFLIRASGGVGIGLNTPTAALHVASSNASPQLQITQYTTNDYTRLRMNVNGSSFWEMDVSSGASPQLEFWNGVERMSIDGSGNVFAKSFNPSSDRNLKENFQAVSPRDVLDKVTAMPITRWNFKEETATPHLGPMAQDFYAAFALGTDDKHIATVDESGVALAAIQGLNQKLDEKNAEIQDLKQQNDALAGRLNGLEAAIKQLAARK